MSVTDRSRRGVTTGRAGNQTSAGRAGNQTHEAWLPPDHPMHRPRHGRRQLTALICAGLFFLTPTITHSVGIHPARFENRPLAGFGDPREGWAWLAELPAWTADHLPFRDSAVRATDAVSRSIFDEPAALSGPPPAPRLAGAAVTPISHPPIAPFPTVIEGNDGWLYLGADVSGACAPSRSLSDTLVSLRRLRAAVEASGRRFILVVPPDKTRVLAPGGRRSRGD
jgi:alginate O-acetyltransferase complex protein AlgJ